MEDKSQCQSIEGERLSTFHRTWQNMFPKEYLEVPVVKGKKIHIGDILIKSEVNFNLTDATDIKLFVNPINRLTIEIQNSSISKEQMLSREDNYCDDNSGLIWIFNVSESDSVIELIGTHVGVIRYRSGKSSFMKLLTITNNMRRIILDYGTEYLYILNPDIKVDQGYLESTIITREAFLAQISKIINVDLKWPDKIKGGDINIYNYNDVVNETNTDISTSDGTNNDAELEKYYEELHKIVSFNATERLQKVHLIIDGIFGVSEANITKCLYEKANNYFNKFDVEQLYKIHEQSFKTNVLNTILHMDPNSLVLQKYVRDFVSKIRTYDSDNQELFNSLEDMCMNKLCEYLKSIDYEDYFRKYIDLNEKGMALYFVEQVKGCVVIPCTKGINCYIWNPNTALWDIGDEHTLVKLVNTRAYPLVEHVVKYAKCKQDTISVQIESLKRERKSHAQETDKLKYYDAIIRRCKVLRDKFNTATAMRNIAKLATQFLCDKEFAKKLNKIEHLLPVKNGLVIDLKTGLSRPRIKEDMFTMEFNVTYNPNVDQEWIDKVDRFMSDLMLGDQVMIDFLKTVSGYGISGDTSMKMFFIFWNDCGNKGGSTFLKFLEHIMGDFYKTANKLVFMASKASLSGVIEAHKPYLLYRRIVTLSETSTIEEFLNDIKGCDTKNLYSTQMNFIPYMKPILVCNSLPQVFTGPVLKSRAIIVKFKADSELRSKLMDENFKSAALLWLIQGAMKFYQSGICVPDCVIKEVNMYSNSQDPILGWISECCIIDKKNASHYTLFRDLHNSFETWRVDNEMPEFSVTALGTYLTKTLKLKKDKKEEGCIAYYGIKLNNE